MDHLATHDLAAARLNRDGATEARLKPPVFLHCGWRTRGTWIWNRMRVMSGIAGYYEPLHEMLAELRPDRVDAFTAEAWQSAHRGIDRPYFEAYRDSLSPALPGVRGYRRSFATEDFFAQPDAPLPELAAYLRALLQAARERGAQPVLKFCRSLGRIGWMQRHFPEAVHVVVLRNPFDQFESARQQYVLTGNGYFLAMPLLLLATNSRLPDVAEATRRLGVALPHLSTNSTLQQRMKTCEAAVLRDDPAGWYRVTLAYWLLTAAAVPDTVDLLIDSDRLARSSSYRRHCAAELASLSGRAVSFADASDSAAVRPAEFRAPLTACLRAHQAAAGLLAHWAQDDCVASPVGAQMVMSLAEATMRTAAGADADQSSKVLSTSAEFRALHEAQARATAAEDHLAAVHASSSWRATAPMRWLGARLR